MARPRRSGSDFAESWIWIWDLPMPVDADMRNCTGRKVSLPLAYKG